MARRIRRTTVECKFTFAAATAAKADSIEIVTIAFGVGDDTCLDVALPAPYSPSTAPALVTQLLADMASPIDGTPADDDGCGDPENADGDNFFCQPRSGELKDVFVQAVSHLAGKRAPRLINLTRRLNRRRSSRSDVRSHAIEHGGNSGCVLPSLSATRAVGSEECPASGSIRARSTSSRGTDASATGSSIASHRRCVSHLASLLATRCDLEVHEKPLRPSDLGDQGTDR